MKKLVSFFLRLSIYNNVHKLLGPRIFKLFKIFFVETKFKKLPILNHPLKIDYKEELMRTYFSGKDKFHFLVIEATKL